MDTLIMECVDEEYLLYFMVNSDLLTSENELKKIGIRLKSLRKSKGYFRNEKRTVSLRAGDGCQATNNLNMNFFKKKDKRENNFDNFPPIGGLMVSKMVVDEQIKPRFMYREKRTRQEDSGWRIFTGFESEEYTDDPNNTGIYNPSTILKIDPSIEDILLKGVGSVYEKTEDGSEWNKVTDFEMEDDYMVTHKLTGNWVIDINNLFERRVEESGEQLYTTGDKSVRIAIWNEEGKSKEEILAEQKEVVEKRDQTVAETLKTFDFFDPEVARLGYMIREEDGGKSYGVIYGFSIIEEQVLQVVIYFDDEEDLDWAIETWKKIRLVGTEG